MGLMKKYDKLIRWGKIWCSQFGRVMDVHCDVGGDGVLLMKLDAIGDFLIRLDSAKEYKGMYPDKKIVLLCNLANVGLAKQTGYFDRIEGIDIKKFETDKKFRKEIIRRFSGEKFELLIQTCYSRTIHMDMLAGAIPAARKVGLVSDESRSNLSRYIIMKSNRKKYDAVYDELFPTTDEWLMEVKRNGELIRALGNTGFMTGMPYLNDNGENKGKVPEGSYYVIFPGASSLKKMWDTRHFAKTADHIWEKTGWTGYICGSNEESYLFDRIESEKKQETAIENFFGKTSLTELAELIRHAKLIVSNDTSGIHFAAVTNTPSVCILGEYNYGRFLPYDVDREYGKELSPMYVCHADMPCKRCGVGKMTKECKKCIASTGRYLCVDRIPVGQVTEAIDKIIDG